MVLITFDKTFHQIERLRYCVWGYRCDTAPASSNTLNTQLFHKTFNHATWRNNWLSLQLLSYLTCAVVTMIFLPDTLNLRCELFIVFIPCTTPLRVLFKCFMPVVRGRCYRQFFADRLVPHWWRYWSIKATIISVCVCPGMGGSRATQEELPSRAPLGQTKPLPYAISHWRVWVRAPHAPALLSADTDQL